MAAKRQSPGCRSDSDCQERIFRRAQAPLADLRVERTVRAVEFRAEGFGTLADFASVVEAGAGEAETRKRDGKGGPEDSER